jgi:hypothetical protein
MQSDRIRSFGEESLRRICSISKAIRPTAFRGMGLALMLASLAGSPAWAEYIGSSTGSIGVGSGSGDNVGNFVLENQWDPNTSGYASAKITLNSTAAYVITVPIIVTGAEFIVHTSVPFVGTLNEGPLGSIPTTTASATTILGYGPFVIQDGTPTITQVYHAHQRTTGGTVDGSSPNPVVHDTGTITSPTHAFASNSASHTGDGTSPIPTYFTQAIFGDVNQTITNNGVTTAFAGTFEIQTSQSGTPLLTTTGDVTPSDVTIVQGADGQVSYAVNLDYTLSSSLNALTSNVQVDTTINASLETILSGVPEPSTGIMFATALIGCGGYYYDRRRRRFAA